MNNLPPVLIGQIATFLSLAESSKLAQTCKRANRAVKNYASNLQVSYEKAHDLCVNVFKNFKICLGKGLQIDTILIGSANIQNIERPLKFDNGFICGFPPRVYHEDGVDMPDSIFKFDLDRYPRRKGESVSKRPADVSVEFKLIFERDDNKTYMKLVSAPDSNEPETGFECTIDHKLRTVTTQVSRDEKFQRFLRAFPWK